MDYDSLYIVLGSWNNWAGDIEWTPEVCFGPFWDKEVAERFADYNFGLKYKSQVLPVYTPLEAEQQFRKLGPKK